MHAIPSYSSTLMNHLLVWRNLSGHGKWDFSFKIEEPEDLVIRNIPLYFGKVVLAEIGFCVITLVATVESVANISLCMVSMTFKLDESYKFYKKRLESSSFTIVWGLANALYFNLILKNTFTHESFARLLVDEKCFLPIKFCWQEESHHFNEAINRLYRVPFEVILNDRETNPNSLKTNFFIRMLLSECDERGIDEFLVSAPDTVQYYGIRFAFLVLFDRLYCFSDEELTEYFDLATIGYIFSAPSRGRIFSQNIIDELNQLTATKQNFNSIPENETTRLALNFLKDIINIEINEIGSPFLKIWEAAKTVIQARRAQTTLDPRILTCEFFNLNHVFA